MNIKDVIIGEKYFYIKGKCVVTAHQVDKATNNVYVRSNAVVNGWNTIDCWVNIKYLNSL